jgi:PPK2 family polyphosphate:nucleotide phosphotransferase
MRDLIRVEPGTRVDLGDRAPDDRLGWEREDAEAATAEAAERLAELGSKLAADGRHALLVVFQGLDAAGKDGAVRRCIGPLSPMMVRTTAFAAPAGEELRHDFLWRVHRELPGRGRVGAFNRSHYEDVLVARVHELVAPDVWRSRYEKINQFEWDLARDGTTIVKVMLHISFEEQRERLQRRLDDPTKHWKYNPADVDERGYWSEYQKAYQDALSECSTDYSPWYVVPANRKWYRDWAVASLLREAFADLRLTYPEGDFDVAAERRRLAASTRPVKHRVTRR